MSQPDEPRAVGAMLGLALGDALGAPYEGGLIERTAWWTLSWLKPGVYRYTDDTEMAMGLARSLIARGRVDADHLARTWAEKARWDRGYGGGAKRVLSLIRRGRPWSEANRAVFPDGSYGNGAAMRIVPLALWHHDDPAALERDTRITSEITHAHPRGVEGALIVARATHAASHNADPAGLLDPQLHHQPMAPYDRRLAAARALLNREPEPAIYARDLGRSIAAEDSTVTAVTVAAAFMDRPFDEMIRFAIAIGGDVDTIAAMAGGIWGARHGVQSLPHKALRRLEDRDEIEQLARQLLHKPRKC